MKLIHTIPLFIHSDEPQFSKNMALVKQCFESLGNSKENMVVAYNQGCLDQAEIAHLLHSFGISAVVLGDGSNVGIARGRQACFEYIWEHHPDVDYISEIHVDMVFPPNWYAPLIEFLEQSEEPMISPGILTGSGELQPLGRYIPLPTDSEALISVLNSLSMDEVYERFVHPVVHKAQILKEIGGYDTQFLQGKQGYEDDSLLLGYLYYMGTKSNWRPKCFCKSWVYHETMAQRMSVPDKNKDFELNEQGLLRQYGAYGIKQLGYIHKNPAAFEHILKNEPQN